MLWFLALIFWLLARVGLHVADYPKSDQWHRPVITPRGGGKAKGYTRPSTLAGILPGKDGLVDYLCYMAVGGAILRPDLRGQVAANWPPDEETKPALKRLVKDLQEAAGSNTGAKNGDTLHTMTANLDRGRLCGDEPHLADYAADLKAYREFVAAAGLEIVPEYIERTVVLEKYGVAGSFDRLVRKDGKLYVLDLKTGAHLGFGEWAVQLALYSRGESLYSWEDETHEDFPEVDQEHGLVLHLPFGQAKPALYVVDLEKGWEAALQAMAIHSWRKTTKELAREARV